MPKITLQYQVYRLFDSGMEPVKRITRNMEEAAERAEFNEVSGGYYFKVGPRQYWMGYRRTELKPKVSPVPPHARTSLDWSRLCQQLKNELNSPLPGGRGFQRQRDMRIRDLARQLGDLDPPSC